MSIFISINFGGIMNFEFLSNGELTYLYLIAKETHSKTIELIEDEMKKRGIEQ